MSFKNRGVQPLMDAIIDYLPSPLERGGITALVEGGDAADAARSGGRPARGHKAAAGQSASSSREAKFAADPNGDLLAYAFKVTVDKQRGPLVFLRVYSGTLEARAQLTNATRGGKERITRLHQVYAKRVEDMDAAPAGSIVMAVGLKATATGDAIVAHSDKRRCADDPTVSMMPLLIYWLVVCWYRHCIFLVIRMFGVSLALLIVHYN